MRASPCFRKSKETKNSFSTNCKNEQHKGLIQRIDETALICLAKISLFKVKNNSLMNQTLYL